MNRRRRPGTKNKRCVRALMGLDDLRDCIAAYVAEDGITCSRENILATNGAKHATELALRVFAEPGDRIIVLAPTYMTTFQTSRNYGLNLLDVPQTVRAWTPINWKRVFARCATTESLCRSSCSIFRNFTIRPALPCLWNGESG